MADKKKQPTEDYTDYVPTVRDARAIKKYLEHQKTESPLRLKLPGKNGSAAIELEHPHPGVAKAALLDALGSNSEDFAAGIINQLAAVNFQGSGASEGELNFFFSVIKGVSPRDQIEGMLAAQMAVVHAASMSYACRLARAENMMEDDIAERALNRLSRTFVALDEAFRRHRTGGELKVAVQHVSVGEGGQAVGKITQAINNNVSKKTPPPLQ
jgi:hypothetical protein